jgi:para-aminobenzoate synthetase component I
VILGDETAPGWLARDKADKPCREGNLLSFMETRLRSGAPFVLLDDQRRNVGRLFVDPVRILTVQAICSIGPAIQEIEKAIEAGLEVAGFLSYRAAASFDRFALCNNPVSQDHPQPPALWFGIFEGHVSGTVGDTGLRTLMTPAIRPVIGRQIYEAMVDAALDHIRAGDIYQANLTFPTWVDISDPINYYRSLRTRAEAPFGALIHTGERTILSCSPELFFRIDGERVSARPMKGTRERSLDPDIDRVLAAELRNSAKDRAENLMILDLLRNDLSRVCMPGSVNVPTRFIVEAYPTVWQMTSTVEAVRSAEIGPVDILRALFPCGSVTGAPKIKASEIIAALEQFDRGIYTGAIGWMSQTESAFNVAIRTIDVPQRLAALAIGRLDVGAGIVADSDPGIEWLECLAKARFAGKVQGADD